MDVYLVVLRIFHILSGVFWVGSALLFFFFIEPSVKETGQIGAAFLGHMVEKKKAAIVVTIAAVVTVVAGVLLYWRSSGGFDLDWITTGPGIGFTLGGLAGISALVLGLVAVKPAIDRMGALGTEVQAGGGTPTEAQAAELHGLETKLRTLGRIDIVLLTLAVLAMATARYL